MSIPPSGKQKKKCIPLGFDSVIVYNYLIPSARGMTIRTWFYFNIKNVFPGVDSYLQILSKINDTG